MATQPGRFRPFQGAFLGFRWCESSALAQSEICRPPAGKGQ